MRRKCLRRLQNRPITSWQFRQAAVLLWVPGLCGTTLLHHRRIFSISQRDAFRLERDRQFASLQGLQRLQQTFRQVVGNAVLVSAIPCRIPKDKLQLIEPLGLTRRSPSLAKKAFVPLMARHSRAKRLTSKPTRSANYRHCAYKYCSKHVAMVHRKKHRCMVNGCKAGAFGLRSDLQKHNKSVHLKKRDKHCAVATCRWSFSRKDHLDRHMRTMHAESLVFSEMESNAG